MEQQTISIAKSGVVCSLAARTAVLAAANPVGGHYNRAKTVNENLKMNPALLSRFDLVFILIDKPDEQADAMLSDHIMNLHRGCKGSMTMIPSGTSLSSIFSATNEPTTLEERLKLKPGEQIDELPHEVMKKYIAYARRYVLPLKVYV